MTLRAGTMQLGCMFSSILLFGAAGLLLFISLQDSTELTPRQVPGESSHSALLPACPPRLPWCQICAKTPGRKRRGPGLLLVGISLNVGRLCLMSDYLLWPLTSGLWPLASALLWGMMARLPISQLVVTFGDTQI